MQVALWLSLRPPIFNSGRAGIDSKNMHDFEPYPAGRASLGSKNMNDFKPYPSGRAGIGSKNMNDFEHPTLQGTPALGQRT